MSRCGINVNITVLLRILPCTMLFVNSNNKLEFERRTVISGRMVKSLYMNLSICHYSYVNIWF